MSRLHLTRRAFLTLGAAAGTGAAYAWGVEPGRFRVVRVPVRIARPRPAAGPLRVVQLTDLHASRVNPLPRLARAVDLAVAQRPALVALTGDYVTLGRPDRAAYVAMLRRLSAAAPCFACLGNNDGGAWAAPFGGEPDTAWIRALLEEAGIRVLYNANARVEAGGMPVELVGVGDLWAGEADVPRAFAGLGPAGDALRLVLAHNPDGKDPFADREWDVMLCGHTHGGQIAVPGLGRPFTPVRDRRFIEGLREWNGRWIHVSRGVGSLAGVRFNCRPEVSVIEMARGGKG